MAKYSVVTLKFEDGNSLDLDNLSRDERNGLELSNVIYIYRSEKSNKVYIGQTGNFIKRHKQHYNGTEEKFEIAEFDQVKVIFSVYFHHSVLYDVEKQLITYFMADKSNKTEVDYNQIEVINATGGNNVNDYKEREDVVSDVILPLWKDELYKNGWVNTMTLEELRTKELVKYSPIKVLTLEQEQLIEEVIANPTKDYVVNGDAGTGKTVLLTHIVARMLQEKPGSKIGVVVQPNWEKTAQNIFKVYGMNSSYLTITTSTRIITEDNEYDVIIIDESHKLSRKYGKQHPSFSKVYANSKYKNCNSHLEILQKMGKQIILMYDVLQAIRPANITRETFSNLTAEYEKKFLKTQFRIQAPDGKKYTSDDYINGIKYLLYKDTGLLNASITNYDPDFNRDVFNDKSSDAYFGYFTENPLHSLIEWVEKDNNFNANHINRVLAGLVEPWAQSDGKDSTITHWHEGKIQRRWNSTQENWINSKEPDAAEQIGSVFAVQGIDLNKVGVLIGPDLEVDRDGKLTANPEKFHNTNGTFTVEEMKDPCNQLEFTLFVLNIYYVLLTRGIDGIRLGFWHNNEFKKYMERTLDIN